MNDDQLVDRARGGDRTSYEELVRRWGPRVLTFCEHRVRRRDIAEDISQEAFIRGYRSLDRLRDAARFGAWVRGIAELACRDWLRSRSASERSLSSIHERGGDHFARREMSLEERVEHDDELRALIEQVDALPPEFRETIVLYYTEEFTYEELGAFLGVSAATVNARLTRARAMLRKRLRKLEG